MRRRFMSNISQGFDSSNYMTIEAIDDIKVSCATRVLNYSYDGYKWQVLFPRDELDILSGSSVFFKNILEKGEIHGVIDIDEGSFNLRGNCLSLIFGDKANENFSLRGYDGVFLSLFMNSYYLKNVDENFLPATELEENCYNSMFSSCGRLEKAPMLPTTELRKYCYFNMFTGCESLVKAPELPASILVDSCYHGMFNGCKILNYVKMLATNISAYKCLESWLYDVASSGTFVKHPDMVDLPDGTGGIPVGWKVVNDGEESEGIDTWLQFPLYFDFDACDTGWATYCYRNPDDISIELERALKDALMQYGDKVDTGVIVTFKLQKSALENLGVKIFFKGIEVDNISITGQENISGIIVWEAIIISLSDSYNVELWGTPYPLDYIFLRDDGEIFIEL